MISPRRVSTSGVGKRRLHDDVRERREGGVEILDQARCRPSDSIVTVDGDRQ